MSDEVDGDAGGGPVKPKLPKFKERDTERARELRNASTPAERRLWVYLSRKQLGVRFNRQMQIGPYFVDFVCRSRRLVIEIDGFSHDVRPGREIRRDAHLCQLGYRVLHFTNDDVSTDVEGVVTAIEQALGLAHS